MKKQRITAGLLVCLLTISVLLLAACQSCGDDGVGETGTTTETGETTLPETLPETGGATTSAPGTETEPDTEGSDRELCHVSFETCVGVSFVGAPAGGSVRKGETVSFSLAVSPFYEGEPTVYLGEETLTADDAGNYSFVVSEDATLRVEGIKLKASTMSGEGTESDDPFLVTSPVDLLYIAEQVNLGNATYINAYYRLENDLDFRGEPAQIIGDGNSDAAVFAGYFNGNGHTISNFRIEATGKQYVGLFGVLQANVAGNQGGAINDLHLKDFTLSAAAEGNSIFCGSLVGYGMGSNLVLCSAENGRIDVYADSNAFSYVGGLVGIQEALDFNSLAYYSAVSYCSTNVEVNCNSGSIYAAGGVVGYMASSAQLVTASINNSFATGVVRGAMRAGGLVGCMAKGTSMTTCYATGEVSAQSFALDVGNSEEFCYAYAGGLVGYAEPGCTLAESFSAATIRSRASVSEKYAVTGELVGYFAQPSEYEYSYVPAVVYNCRYAEGGVDGDIKLTDGAYLQNELHWNPYDWNFIAGQYPTVNTEQHTDYTFEIKFLFGGEAGLSVSDFNVYMPLSFWYADGQLPSQLSGDEGDNRVSYGYFFDEACTLPIPDSFIPTHDMTVYAAVADVTPIVGDYILTLSPSEKPLIFTLNADSTCTYPDAGQTVTISYLYDGEHIIFENARFARFLADVTGIGKYQLYTFRGTVVDGQLTICGGVYENETTGTSTVFFPTTAPLTAIYCDRALAGTFTDGTVTYTLWVNGTGIRREGTTVTDLTYTRKGDELTVLCGGKTFAGRVTDDGLTIDGKTFSLRDAYTGSWTVDSGAHKVYTFDGIGNWSYIYYGYRTTGNAVNKTTYEYLSGTYTVESDGSLTLSGGMSGTARLTDGVLTVSTTDATLTCHRDGGWYGNWLYEDYGLTLKLSGIRADGRGDVRVEFVHENGTLEAYDMIYAIDEMDGNTICLYYDQEVFGYLTYLPARGVLRAMMYVGTMNSFMDNVRLHREDEYVGSWIGERADLPMLEFNGKGSYSGTITVGGQTVPYTLDEATLSGSFVLNGKSYRMTYSEADGSITVNGNGIETVYRRKDAYGDLILTDKNGGLYSFDGRGELTDGGTLLATAADGTVTTYTYRVAADGSLRLYADGRPVGVLGVDESAQLYRLTLEGASSVELSIRTRYTGVWAMSGSLTNMTIGAMDLDGKLSGVVNDISVIFTMQADGTLLFQFEGTDFYVIPVGDTDLVLSANKDWYLYNDQILCAPVDEMFGAWQNSLGAAYRFDGMSGSTLTSGAAQSGMLNGEEMANSTSFAYSFRDGRYILWTIDETTGETSINRLSFCDPSTPRAFVNGDKAFIVEKGDRLYRTEALDVDSGITYTFDGFGTVTTSDGRTLAYTFVSVDYTAGIAVATITVDGTTLTATVDFSGVTCTVTLTAQ